LLAVIRLQYHLALQYKDELVLARVRMPVRGLPSWNNPGQVDAEIPQAGVIAEPPIVPHLIGGPMRLRITGEIALSYNARIKCRKFWL
jgi:hypothetical protein